jgi:outer membrane immunogenic protein
MLGAAMKKLLLAGVALAALAGSATAADLGRPVYRRPVVYAPVYSWTGLYVGGNIGYTWGRSDYRLAYPSNGAAPPDFSVLFPQIQAAPAIAGTGSLSPNGVIGGFQGGYNAQFNMFVVGFEVDLSASGLKKTSILNTIFPPGLGNVFSGQPLNVTTSIQNTWLATFRPRLGLAVDRALFYVTGGLAVGDVKYLQINNGKAIFQPILPTSHPSPAPRQVGRPAPAQPMRSTTIGAFVRNICTATWAASA